MRRQSLLDVEQHSDPLLRYPPDKVDIDAARAAVSLERTSAEEASAAEGFFRDAFDNQDRPPVVGQLITDLLAFAPPGKRPNWLVGQIERWLLKLTYLEPQARREVSEGMAQLGEVRLARAGELIERQGHLGDTCYILLTGQCSAHLDVFAVSKPSWRPGADSPDSSPRDASASSRPSSAAKEAAGTAVSAADDAMVENVAEAVNEPPSEEQPIADQVHADGSHEGEAGREAANPLPTTAIDAEPSSGCNAEAEAAPPAVAEATTVAASGEDDRAASLTSETPSDRFLDPALLMNKHGELMHTLAPGDGFGEWSCVLRETRPASLVANCASALLVLRRRHLSAFFGSSPSLSQRMRFLSSMQLLLPPRDVHSFAEVRVPKGTLIVPLGAPIERLMLIWSGSVSLLAPREGDADEREAARGGGVNGSDVAGGGTAGGGERRLSGGGTTSGHSSRNSSRHSSRRSSAARMAAQATVAAARLQSGGETTASLDMDVDEISVVCSGGCLCDELLLPALASSRPSSAMARAASSSGRGSARGDKRVVVAPYAAVAREDTSLLVLSRHDLERLPIALLRQFKRDAGKRHSHHEGQAARLNRRAPLEEVSRSLKTLAPAPASSLGPPPRRVGSAQRQRPSDGLGSARLEEAPVLPPLPAAPPPAPSAGLPVNNSLVNGSSMVGMSYMLITSDRRVDSRRDADVDGLVGAYDAASAAAGDGSALLAASSSMESLLLPMRVLTYGRLGATDEAEARRLAKQHSWHKRSMPEVIAARRRPPPAINSLPLAKAPAREPKFRELDSTPLSAIVDDVRVPGADTAIEHLRREVQEARLKAGQSAFTPPSNSASTYVQLRRMALEREFSSKRCKMTKAFLLPSASEPALRPKLVQRPSPPRRTLEAKNVLELDGRKMDQLTDPNSAHRDESPERQKRPVVRAEAPTKWMAF